MIAARHEAPFFADFHEMVDKVDCVSVATPTTDHLRACRPFLEAGRHVLVEKPIAATLDEGREMIRLAEASGAVLQVGHLERFNPAFLAARPLIDGPRFFEIHRLGVFVPRSLDVNVVLDLMIHDIDIIQTIVGSPVEQINSIGAPVFTDEEDIANARIQFENGCVANVTASRISLKSERKMRIFQSDSYISVDFQNKTLAVFRKGSGEMFPGVPNVSMEEKSFEQGDALKAEIASFLECIRTGRPPVVSGSDGKRALETALKISSTL